MTLHDSMSSTWFAEAEDASSILFVDDHRMTLEMGRKGLVGAGYTVHAAPNISEARRLLRSRVVDLMVLDVRLPDGSGLDLCADMRRSTDLPVILISGADTPADRIAGFAAGADDYVVKPLLYSELTHRIAAILRRSRAHMAQGNLEGPHGLLLNPHDGDVECAGRHTRLTKLETGLLRTLIESDGVAVSLDELSRRVWKYETAGDPNFLHQHISRLRRKLEGIGVPRSAITTAYGVGYALVSGGAEACLDPVGSLAERH